MRVRKKGQGPAWQADFEPPEPLRAATWHLEPLRPEVSDADHAAWSSCRARLRHELRWNGWPSPTFSPEDNLVDLADHHAEFERREAYAYSVFAGARCIGCIYIEPWHDAAQLAFWWVDDHLPGQATRLGRLLDWLERWPFSRIIVPVRAHNTRDRDCLVELGLAPAEGHMARSHEQITKNTK